MPKRHAKTSEELETLLIEGFLSGEPVTEEITAEAVGTCDAHPVLIQLPPPSESAL